jgi:hypothetical protein
LKESNYEKIYCFDSCTDARDVLIVLRDNGRRARDDYYDDAPDDDYNACASGWNNRNHYDAHNRRLLIFDSGLIQRDAQRRFSIKGLTKTELTL